MPYMCTHFNYITTRATNESILITSASLSIAESDISDQKTSTTISWDRDISQIELYTCKEKI